MKSKIILLLFIMFFLSCKEKEVEICTGFELEGATLTDSLDYVIFNTIIDSIYTDFQHIHILQHTKSSVNIENIVSRLVNHNIEVDTFTLQNYKSKNNSIYILSDKFKQKNVFLFGASEAKCLSGWTNYYNKYPTSTGHYTFRRPGFNLYNDNAIIEYEWLAGPQTGEGYIILLEKGSKKWEITHNFVTYVY